MGAEHPDIPGYDIVARLAAGGMAEIFLAMRRGAARFTRPVVLKRILPHLRSDEDSVQMFLQEARVMSAIRHPNVVQILDLIADDERAEYMMVLEYLEGESVARLARAADGCEPELAMLVVAEAAAGLHAAHRAVDHRGRALNVVHRDVSPQNIVVTYEGEVKLLDFGVARYDQRELRTQSGILKGKASYMSPEQIEGMELDARSDVFALGVVLHELLTGARLFARPAGAATLKAVLDAPIPAPSTIDPRIPPELDEVCLSALERDRQKRTATAGELSDALMRLLVQRTPLPDARARLRTRMTELFGDRRAKKLELLRTGAVDPASAELALTVAERPTTGAETPTTTDFQGASSRRLWIAAAVLLGAVATGAALALTGGDETPVATRTDAPAEMGGAPAVDAFVAEPDAGSPVAPDAGVPTTLVYRPVTASLHAGDTIVCEASPCSFVAEPAAVYELRARGHRPRRIEPVGGESMEVTLRPLRRRRRAPAMEEEPLDFDRWDR